MSTRLRLKTGEGLLTVNKGLGQFIDPGINQQGIVETKPYTHFLK
jgi:hypothetical protein